MQVLYVDVCFLGFRYVCVLKEYTKEGYRPILLKFQDTDPAKFDMVNAVHAGLMSFCVQMEVDDRVPGYVAMLDFTGITMSHIMKVSLTALKQLLVFVQVRNHPGDGGLRLTGPVLRSVCL